MPADNKVNWLIMTTRGIRNNNPGNIDRNGTVWKGMSPDQTDPRFIVFNTPEDGIRALAIVLLNYQRHDDCDTLSQIIHRWAPAVENDTAAYVAAVAKDCGASPDAPIELDTIAVMRPLVEAIIRHENGAQPYTEAQILKGLNMAGVVHA